MWTANYDQYENYLKNVINQDINIMTFKSNTFYNGVLEHVSKSQGEDYLVEIQNRFSLIYNTHINYLKDICHQNDLYGFPLKCHFNGFTYCSPTNLRYILHSLLILTFMKDNMLNDIDIIEIGGGYGGLCFFLYNLSSIFNININSYSLFDLPYPLLLQEKYLKKLNINTANFVDFNNIQNLKKNSFLISNYAFSELTMKLQILYTNNVLNPYTSFGFLVWNNKHLYRFIDDKYVTIEPEFPTTNLNLDNPNKFIRFRPMNNLDI
jgi:hypothetical protein